MVVTPAALFTRSLAPSTSEIVPPEIVALWLNVMLDAVTELTSTEAPAVLNTAAFPVAVHDSAGLQLEAVSQWVPLPPIHVVVAARAGEAPDKTPAMTRQTNNVVRQWKLIRSDRSDGRE